MRLPACLLCLIILAPSAGAATTLREAVQAAGPANGYDRWVELETGVVYRGGLLNGPIFRPYSDTPFGPAGEDLRIVGNGAILDLQGGQICVSFCNNRLDIDDCVIINGGVRFRGYHPSDLHPVGSVRNITFWRPHDYAVRTQNTGPGIEIEDNLVVDVVDTGWDFIPNTGIPSEWMPTGTSISACITIAAPQMRDNWTFHTDPELNADPLTHFSFL